MAFGKKNDTSGQADGTDFVRIPQGTRISAGPDGKLKLSFAGDISFGEQLPELSELECGRNLSIDPGVTIKADIVRVKSALELEEGAHLETRELEVERLVSRKAHVKARTINAGEMLAENSVVVADRITAREGVVLDRGDMEIGTVMAQSLTIGKGTNANILIREVAKLDGEIPKGGYENFGEFLTKVFQYHPEILNDRFNNEARRLLGHKPQEAGQPAANEATAEAAKTPAAGPDPRPRLVQNAKRIRSVYPELPKDVSEFVGHLEAGRIDEVRRDMQSAYQRLQALGKLPAQVPDIFRDIQETLTRPTRPEGAPA